MFAVNGFNFGGRGQNASILFIKLRDWDERGAASLKARAVAARANAHFRKTVRDAMLFVVPPPSVMELGNVTGFDFMLMDRAGVGHEAAGRAQPAAGRRGQEPVLQGVRPNGIEDAPQYQLDIDREKARALGVAVSDINSTLATAWGSSYVNDFIDRGRVKKVFVQGDASARMLPEDLEKWYVRNKNGDMVPFSAFSSASWTYGPQKLNRYNGSPSFNIQGQAAPGYSSGAAMQEMERLAAQLPTGVGYEWTGMSFEERLSGAQAPALYAISLIVVFLCLAALYESWSIPSAVMLVVPLGIIGRWPRPAARAVQRRVLPGGAADHRGPGGEERDPDRGIRQGALRVGGGLIESAIHAARQRLRPILMTSLAFILGVVPLAISSGAGSGSQNAIGTGVIGGMLTATFLAIFFVPTFFVVMLAVQGQAHERTARQARNRRRGGGTCAMMIPMRTLLSVSLAAALAGCSLAPTYERPDAPVSAAYPAGAAYKPDAVNPAGVATADVGWRDSSPTRCCSG